jgi:uncharacterized OB-fold protein
MLRRGAAVVVGVAERAPHPVLTEQCPLAIAVVVLEEGPRMITNVVGCDPSDVEIGMKVKVSFEAIDESDQVLPVFESI